VLIAVTVLLVGVVEVAGSHHPHCRATAPRTRVARCQRCAAHAVVAALLVEP